MTNVLESELISSKQSYQQNEANIPQSSIITEWIKGNPLPIPITGSQVAIIKDKVYLFGGYNDKKGYLSTIFAAPINEDGTLGQWVLSGSLPIKVSNSQIVVIKNRIYLLGGCKHDYIFNYTLSDVYTAPIYDDGSIGKWTKSDPLPIPVENGKAIVIKDKVYLFGGYDYNHEKDYLSTIITASIKKDGKLGKWKISGSLPIKVTYSQVIMIKNRIYLLGGRAGYNRILSSGLVSTIYTASINEDGKFGQWEVNGRLHRSLVYNNEVIVTKNKVYLFSNYIESIYESTIPSIFIAPIDNDGVLGEWTVGPSTPIEVRKTQAILIKDKIHLLGGYTFEDGYLPDVYTAALVDNES